MGGRREYDKPSVTADCVVLAPDEEAGGGGRMRVLLIRRAKDPFAGKWALPGGFVNKDESLRAAALRELKEETGVRATRLRQVGAFGDPGRDPRGWVISVAYVSVLPRAARATQADDASDAQWFPLERLPPLAFDHRKILKEALALVGLRESAESRP